MTGGAEVANVIALLMIIILAGGIGALDGVGGFQGTVWGLCMTRVSRHATMELIVQTYVSARWRQ
jgi:hypothetical protein